MRDGLRLNHEELREQAHALARASTSTYAEIAAELGVTKTAVAHALTTTGDKFQRLQRRIVGLLSDYEVERRENVFFEAKKSSSLRR